MIYQPPFYGEKKFHVGVSDGGDFPLHWHEEVELMYCLCGRVRVSFEHGHAEAAVGEAILVNSTEAHTYEPEGEDTRVLIVEGGSRLLGEEFRLFTTHRYDAHLIDLTAPTGWQSETRLLLKKLCEAQENGERPENKWMIHGCILTVFATLCANLPLTPVKNDTYKRSLLGLHNLRPALDLVEHHYAENITVARAADLVGYEKTSFCRLFKMIIGVTFLQYLNQCRIGEAKYLLAHSNLGVHEIGRQVGMDYHQTFCRIFKQYCGMSPGEYRKSNKR